MSEKKKFTDLQTGNIFKAHDCLWVKISRTAARSLPQNRYGACNFVLTPEDNENIEIVEEKTLANKIMELFNA